MFPDSSSVHPPKVNLQALSKWPIAGAIIGAIAGSAWMWLALEFMASHASPAPH
jgi:hypothetical protein